MPHRCSFWDALYALVDGFIHMCTSWHMLEALSGVSGIFFQPMYISMTSYGSIDDGHSCNLLQEHRALTAIQKSAAAWSLNLVSN